METEEPKYNKEASKVKDYLMFGMIVLVLAISVFQSLQIKSIKSQMTANVIKNSDITDMAGWTDDEKMQYEHHGIMPARFKQTKETSQVGSC